MDREIEHSFSQVLARGKYVHSIVFHEVLPDKVDEYVETVGNWYPRTASMPENKVHLVGSWRTEVGDTDTFGTCFLLIASIATTMMSVTDNLQCISGNTSGITAITSRSTPFTTIPTILPSTRSSGR